MEKKTRYFHKQTTNDSHNFQRLESIIFIFDETDFWETDWVIVRPLSYQRTYVKHVKHGSYEAKAVDDYDYD